MPEATSYWLTRLPINQYPYAVADQIKWAKTVDPKHYEAALSYLSLKYDPETAKTIVGRLRRARVETKHAADILRASGLKPLKTKDPGVKHEASKLDEGKELQPVLVLSKPVGADIADGYHRTSLAYGEDPFAPVACKVVSVDY